MGGIRILIVSTTGMGDALWGTPGIRDLKEAFPDAIIDLVVKNEWFGLFRHNPHLNKIYPYNFTLAFKLLFAPKYSHVFIFHANKDFRRMKLFLKSSPIWHHQSHKWAPVEYKVNPDHVLQRKYNNSALSSNQHAIQRRACMLEEALNIECKQSQMEIFFESKSYDATKPFIVLHIGASTEKRQWEIEKFYALANLILEKTSLNIVFGGNEKEKEILKSIQIQDNKRISHAFNMNILDYAYLISQAKLLISNNTGPMHIGYAVQIPTIGIFLNVSNGNPKSCGPYNLNKMYFPVVYSVVMPSVDKVWEHFEDIYKKTDCFRQNPIYDQ